MENHIVDSNAELMQLRLVVLYGSWRIDRLMDDKAVRHDIAALEVLSPQTLHDITQRSLQVHGALGATEEMPLARMGQRATTMGLVDGPAEVRRVIVARHLLKGSRPAAGKWPSEWILTTQQAAREKHAEYLAAWSADRS